MKTLQFLKSLWEEITKRGNRADSQADHLQNPAASMPPYRYRAVQQHPTAYEKQHYAAEKYYWQEQLRLAKDLNVLTKWLNWITGVASVVGVVGLIFVACTLAATIRQADIAEKSLALSKRPWVGLGKIIPKNRLIPGEPLEILVEIKNAGDSPGLRMVLHNIFDLWVRTEKDKRVPFWNDPRMAPCVGPEPQQGGNIDMGGILVLPTTNDSYIASYKSEVLNEAVIKVLESEKGQKVSVPGKDLDMIPQADNRPGEQETVGLYFVGCFNYFDELRVAHRTTFCYRHEPTPPNGIFVACEEGNHAT